MFKKVLTIFLSIIVFVSTIATIACSENDFKKAAEATKDLNKITLRAIRATDAAFDKQLISLQVKDRLADALSVIARSGKSGTELLKYLHDTYGNLENVPRAKWLEFTRLFDDGVVKPFLDILITLNTLTDHQSNEIRIAIAAIRSAILIIAGAFNQRAKYENLINKTAKFDMEIARTVQSQSFGGMSVNWA